jgi:adenine-specific DNA-methyltransferase
VPNHAINVPNAPSYGTETVFDYLIWYCRNRELIKVRDLFEARSKPEEETKFNTIVTPDLVFHNVSQIEEAESAAIVDRGGKWARVNYPIVSQHPSETRSKDYPFRGKMKQCGANKQWRFGPDDGMKRLEEADRLFDGGGASLGGVVFWEDWNQVAKSNIWGDIHGEKFPTYVVQTATSAIQRCILMATDPGDLVLDPTCGSGTTGYVAEQWGRRWITVDTSRVALALARARIMSARYSFYLLADSREGQLKEAEVTRTAPSSQPVHGNIRHGFVYERVPHITLKSIANNAEIDVIWDKWQGKLEPLRESLNIALKKSWQEWEIPREAEANWADAAKRLHADWWLARIARQKEIDASIAAKAEFEYLFDKPYNDKKKVRVAGPFTFTALTPWPGYFICAEGRYLEDTSTEPSTSGRGQGEGGVEKRAAIFIGPEFGTVTRPDLVAAAREAGDADFDVLIACAFNYEAHATEFSRLGRIPVLKARMNADLHMAEDLKNTGKGNLFVIFGEPDIDILPAEEGKIRVRVNGVDVFHPQTGEVRSDGPDGIACWFIDADYNEESFFVRHAYFLGANDPYSALKTTLKAEINEEAWATLNSDTSRPFDKPSSGRIAVKVINHLGDEVMKVFRV